MLLNNKPSLSRTLTTAALLLISAWAGSAARAEEEIRILRDEFGVPHIFAPTEEGVCYGMGYAQAQDRLEELLRQYRRATGTMSEAFGPSHVRHDWRQRLWQHAFMAKEKYHTLNQKTRALIEAYQAGVKQYMSEHPAEVPAWAPELEPWMCVALSRYIIWGWPEGDAGGDMLRGGIQPDPIEYHGSNQWLVAPERTQYSAPIALIDPHLGWYGQFRFYEVRMYGGEIQFSGMAILGMPLPSLGHSRFCSIAMTTGGPDAADCYEEELNPDNPRQYRYDGQWRDMTVRTEVLRVKNGETIKEQELEIEYTHHGPVVAHKEGKAYVLKLSYFDQVLLSEQVYKMIVARNLAEMKEAIGMLQLMEQNIMIGTIDGDIYYVRNGRVPVRAPGFDYKRPLPGNSSKSEWRGIHKFEDLLQIHNPPQGYMQNCNVSPQFMMKDSTLAPEEWKDRIYLFNGFLGDVETRADNPLHQRAAMCVELLHDAKQISVEQAMSIANSYDVFGADVWQKMLKKAWKSAGADIRDDKNSAKLYQQIIDWDRRTDPDSTGAIAYKYWKSQFGPEVLLADRAGFPPPQSVTSEQILENIVKGAEKLLADHGRLDVPFGEVYRTGRRGTEKTWPVGGGSVGGIATPRAIGFNSIEGEKRYLAGGGQTSTQIVLLTNPPKSWTYLPLGQSDHADSPHYDDQAEKLFSKAIMKPTYFLDREELDKHVQSNKTVHRQVPAP